MRRLPLRLTVVVLLAPLVAAAILGAIAFQVHRQETRRLVGERDGRAVRAAAVGLTERVYIQVTALRTLADRMSDGVPLQQLASESEALFGQFDGGVAFYDPQQNLVAGAPSNEVWQQRPFVHELLTFLGQGSGPAFSPLKQDAPMRNVVLFIAMPSARHNIVAIGALSPQQLGIPTLVSGLQATQNASAFLVDLNGQLIYHTNESLIGSDWRDHPGVAESLRGESGAYYRRLPSPGGESHSLLGLQPDNEEHVIAYSGVGWVGWGLVVEEPWVDVVSPLMRFSEAIQFILLPAGLLAALALYFGVRSIVRPLQLLDEQAARLGWGEFEAIEEPVGGIAEIRALQATLIQMAEQVQSYQAGMRGYLAALTQGQEDERKRLARELHDETVQSLIALDQRVQMAQKALGRDPPACFAQLDELRAMTTEVVQEVRRFSRNLRPIYLEDLGLIPALEMLTRDATSGSAAAGLATSFRVTGEPKRLTAEREMALYRIVQEALNNVASHSKASCADVNVTFTESEVAVTIADDGAGFAIPDRPGELAEAGHYGLLGMRERAELADGWLSIESEPGHGTRIEIHLPV
jgi:signal transduction histidine kinase